MSHGRLALHTADTIAPTPQGDRDRTVSAPGRSRRRPGRAAPLSRTPAHRGRPGCSRAGRSRTRCRAGRTRRDSRPFRRHTRRRSTRRQPWRSRPRHRSSPWGSRRCTPLRSSSGWAGRARRRWHASDDVVHETTSIEAINRLPFKLRVMMGSPTGPRALAQKPHSPCATRRRVGPAGVNLICPILKI